MQMSNFLIAFGAIIMFLGTGICVALTIILLCKSKKATPFIIGILGSMIIGGILLGIGCARQPKSEHKEVAYNTTEAEVTEKPTTEDITETPTTEEATEEETEATTEEVNATDISGMQFQSYWDMAKETVESCLKNPKSADFPSSVFNQGNIAMERKGHLVVVQSYVYSTNSFGAEIKSDFTVEMLVYDTDNFIYDVVYLNINGETTGEYVSLDEWDETNTSGESE